MGALVFEFSRSLGIGPRFQDALTMYHCTKIKAIFPGFYLRF